MVLDSKVCPFWCLSRSLRYYKVEMGCVEGEGRALRELVGAAGAAASRNPSLLPRLAAPVAPRLFTTVITLVMT